MKKRVRQSKKKVKAAGLTEQFKKEIEKNRDKEKGQPDLAELEKRITAIEEYLMARE